MTNEFIPLLDSPEQMEAYYHQNPIHFQEALHHALQKDPNHPVLLTWKARVDYKKAAQPNRWWEGIGSLTLLAVITGFWINIPNVFDLDADRFYPRNLGVIPLVAVTIYFAHRHGFKPLQWVALIAALCGIVTYMNILPFNEDSDTLILACLFSPILIWGILGYSYSGGQLRVLEKRMQFLAFHGDWVLIGAILLAVSAVLGMLTALLFELINYSLELTFLPYVAVGGIACIPLFSAHLNSLFPKLVSHVSPLIARLFTPVVLIMLLAYLATIIISGTNPYVDRQSLIVFNGLLVGVMVILIFSIAGSGKEILPTWQRISLLALTTTTIVINSIALSAIILRTAEWGFTPNRVAVTGTNLVMLLHLIWVAIALYRTLRKPMPAAYLHIALTKYLPVYLIWAAIMTFAMPVLFGFK